MAIKVGSRIVAKDVENKLIAGLYKLSSEAIGIYSVIFDANNSVYNSSSLDSNNLWSDIRLPSDGGYNEMANQFLSNLYTRVTAVPDIINELSVCKEKETYLSGFRNAVLSCYSYASNIRNTLISYFSNNGNLIKINNMFLSKNAIESISTNGSLLLSNNMFYNQTSENAASCAYDTIPLFKQKFGTHRSSIDNVSYTLTGNNSSSIFYNFGNDNTEITEGTTKPVLYVGDTMYAKDVNICIQYMDDLVRYIRDNLSCKYGIFKPNTYISVVYVPYKGTEKYAGVSVLQTNNNYAKGVLSNDNPYSVKVDFNHFSLSSIDKIYNADNHSFVANKLLSNFFIGWTLDKAIKDIDDPATLTAFWDKNQTSVDLEADVLPKQISAFKTMAKQDSSEMILSVYPVYMTTFPLECYYGWWRAEWSVNDGYNGLQTDGGATWGSNGVCPGYSSRTTAGGETIYTYKIGNNPITCDLANLVDDQNWKKVKGTPCGFIRNDGPIWNANTYIDASNSNITSFIKNLSAKNYDNIENKLSAKFRYLSSQIKTFTGDADIVVLSSYMDAIKWGASWCGYLSNLNDGRHNIQDFGSDYDAREQFVVFDKWTGKSKVQNVVSNSAHPRNAAGDDGKQDGNLIIEYDNSKVSIYDRMCPQNESSDITQSWYYYKNSNVIPRDLVSNTRLSPTLRFINGKAVFSIKFEILKRHIDSKTNWGTIDFWLRNPNCVIFSSNRTSIDTNTARLQYSGPYYNSTNRTTWLSSRKKDIISNEHNFHPTAAIINAYGTVGFIPEWGCHIEGLKLRFARFEPHYPGYPPIANTGRPS